LKKKLFIIGCSGIPARYGGFETFAENIALELTKNLEISVICSSKLYGPSEQELNWKSIRRIFFNVDPNGIRSILYDLKGLLLAVKESDYILLLGIGAAILLPFIPFLKSKYLCVHVDGIEWKRSKWNIVAKLFLRLGYILSLRYAKTIILDSKALAQYVPNKYLKKIAYINYGGNHLHQFLPLSTLKDSSYALVIARAEPENNLLLVLKVFHKNQNLKLIIISNWNHTRYGKKLCESYSKAPNIQMIDAIYDDMSKLQQYRANCTLYIHGHSAGGTNPSLVEAMFTGLPVIAWDNIFNRVTTHDLAFYFKTEEELEKQLVSLKKPELLRCAKELSKYAKQNYTWNIAAKKILELIEQ